MRGIRLVVCVVVVLSWSSVFAADEPSQGLGQLVVTDAQAGSPVRLNVAAYHAHVVMQPPVALVQIDQSFYNPYPRQEEGTFVFSLPTGASVSRFAMYVSPGNLVEGELIERSRAARVYQTIVDRQRDPAILEQIGDNLFKMRVFPIPARNVKRILLDYTVPLEADGEGNAFRLPLFSDLEPIWDFRLSGVIRAAVRPGGVGCLSHPEIEFKQDGDGSVGFELVKKNHRPTTDLELNFVEESRPNVELRNCVTNPLYRQANDDVPAERKPSFDANLYFQLSIPYAAVGEERSAGEAAPSRPGPADVLVLVDTSSSMRGCRLLRSAVGDILRKLRPEDRFRLACVDLGVRPLGKEWLTGEGENTAAALEAFDNEFFLGATDLGASLDEAAQLFDESSDRRRLIVYVGDGRQSGENVDFETRQAQIVARLAEADAALIGVLVRRDPLGREFMASLARAGGGLTFDLTESLLARRDMSAWLSSGMAHPEKIERIEIAGCAADDLYYPAAWLPGRTLHVFGRMNHRDLIEATIATRRNGEKIERRWELKVDESRNDVFVGRLWAQRRLDRMRGKVPQGADVQTFLTPEEKSGMIELSQEWSLLTPLTAFLVLESENDYRAWGIDRRNRHRYWSPPDARPPVELPEDWTRRAKEQVERVGLSGDAQGISMILRTAREAIEGGNPSLADRLLQSVVDLPDASREEYEELTRQARAAIRREGATKLLGAYRDKLDPATSASGRERRLDLLSRLSGEAEVNREFLERHPCAKQLLRETPVILHGGKSNKKWYHSRGEEDPRNSQPAEAAAGENPFSGQDALAPRTIDDLAAMLRRESKMNVVVDYRALDDVGIKTENELHGYGRGRMSLRAYARFLLGQCDLTLLEQPHRLCITTPEQAETELTAEVYPIPDFLMADRMAARDQLLNPYLDRRLAAERRIREKLKRPIDVKFINTPLKEVVDYFAKELNDTVLVDEKALADVGIDIHTSITADWRDVPARDSLRWILHDFGLTYRTGDEALLITTPEAAENTSELRLHSGRGIVFEYAVPANQDNFGPFPGAMGGFGGGMGMGGMGFFGGGMGMMGGMGGMAMGGMGGTLGGGPSPAIEPAPDPSISLSSGGDDTLPEESETPDSTPSSGIEGRDGRAFARSAPSREETSGQQYVHDIDSINNLLTSTVQPTTWDDVGGPGTIAFCESTLDFVVKATEDVHEEIEMLFARLRKLPPMDIGDGAWRPAALRSDSVSDFDYIIDMITSTVLNRTWDEVGGPGSIAPHEPYGALIVSQTQEVHDKIAELLTMLRRSRYESLHGERPWLWTAPSPDRPLIAPWPEHDWPATSMSELPQANAEELEALAERRAEQSGFWLWRRTSDDGKDSQEISLLCHNGRIELKSNDCTLIAEGDQAKIVWHDLHFIELGNWGEDVRRLADRLLPWMPHRTNEELARMFQVARTESGRVRLTPNGLPKNADSFLEAEFSGDSPLPRFWMTQLAGRPTGRLSTANADGRPTVTFSDGDDKDLARWELIDSRTPFVPRLSTETKAAWNDFVSLDRRSPQAAVDKLLAEAVCAIVKADWDEATGALRKMLNVYPRQPLLLLLTAWCHENNPGFCSRELTIDALKQLARQGAGPLTRHIDGRFFPSLAPAERYDILSCLPPESLKAEDWDRLAAAAAEAGRATESLAHARAALRSDGGRRLFERRRLVVELLLRLERGDEAAESAVRWAAEAPPEQAAELAELLAKFGRSQMADELFFRILEDKNLTTNARYGLLCRRASVHRGQLRWQLLLEAAETAKQDSPGRNRALDLIVAELTEPIQAETAGQLAAAAKSPDIKFRMLLAQADLSVVLQDRSELFWEVYQSGRLPENRYDTAFGAWNAENHPERVIEVAETVLRRGERLKTDGQMRELSLAYRNAGRELDARRAAFDDPPPEKPRDSGSRRPRGGMGFF